MNGSCYKIVPVAAVKSPAQLLIGETEYDRMCEEQAAERERNNIVILSKEDLGTENLMEV